MKERYTDKQIEEMIKNSKQEIIEDDSDIVDQFGNKIDVDEVIRQAEEDIQRKYPKVNFRWSEFEIVRAKKIAKQLGLPYQTYIKSLLKQGMDKDEKRLKEM